MNEIFAAGFNRQNLKVAREAIEKALSGLDLGFEVKLGNISFLDDSFTCKIEASLPGKVDRKSEKEKQMLASMGRMYGIDVTREPFINGRGVCKLVGFNTRAPKNPWIVVHGDGKQYKYPTDEVSRHWMANFTLKTE
ncbi:hypothetical protein SAMN05216178_6628 [Pseudomonas saponiphila]|jgi:hypothetical protein|uniref:Uncharacterized protein n=1 Tax=Pseudomonas saponiphila TaxID=556534 RepID=A0A1H4ZH45_9PSED|nr:hypothetical protein [Pseudomonas saponiphila]SED28814.1 hypothetical protein SAMN05216178_6628 [Pseudomonas saponiphila]